MNPEINTDQALDEYISGKMTYAETELLLTGANVPEAGALIALHKAAAVAIQRNEVIRQVKKVHETFLAGQLSPATAPLPADTGKVKIRKISFLRWTAAAAAAIIVLISSWYIYQMNAASSSKLYSEMYQAYNVNTNRNEFDQVATHDMVQQYRDKNYKTVISIFQSLPVSTNREKFLTAMAFQETGDYNKAADLLELIIRENQLSGSRLYNDEAEFYAGLNYLKMKKNNLAFTIFQKIYKTPGHTFHERVSKWTMTRLKWLK